MAITVFKEGVNPNFKYALRCPTCGSILEYGIEDAYAETQISSWHEMHLICPTCKHPVGHNMNHPEKVISFTGTGTTLYCTGGSSVKIPDGCTAQAIYLNGSHIELYPLDKVMPNDHSILITGDFTELTILTSVVIPDEHPDMTNLKLIDIRDLEEPAAKIYNVISADNKIVPASGGTIFAIAPNQVSAVSEIHVND